MRPSPGDTATVRAGALVLVAASLLAGSCAHRPEKGPAFPEETARPLTFAVVSDTHIRGRGETGNAVFSRIARRIDELRPDFLVHCGDWIIGPTYDQGDEGTADTLMRYIDLLDPSIAFYPVLGNHEADYVDFTYARSFFPVLKDGWYSFDRGPAHFFVVENNSDAPDSNLPGYEHCLPNGGINTPGSPQRMWLEMDLASRPAGTLWTFGFGHRAYYGAEQYAGRKNIESARRGEGSFCGLIEDARVDVFFNGDQHCYTRTTPIRGGRAWPESDSSTVYLTVGGGGGRINRGENAGRPFPDLEDFPDGAYVAGTRSEHFFVHCTVDGRLFRADVIDTSGAVIDSFTIRK
jgi:hypothetical protein